MKATTDRGRVYAEIIGRRPCIGNRFSGLQNCTLFSKRQADKLILAYILIGRTYRNPASAPYAGFPGHRFPEEKLPEAGSGVPPGKAGAEPLQPPPRAILPSSVNTPRTHRFWRYFLRFGQVLRPRASRIGRLWVLEGSCRFRKPCCHRPCPPFSTPRRGFGAPAANTPL